MRISRKKKDSIKANFEQFLKDYNCSYTVNEEKENGVTYFNFEFQAGHFIAAVRKQDDCIEVTFPSITTVPVSQLPLVRTKCNDHNSSNILFKFTYSLDHEDNQVSVHLSFFNNKFDAITMLSELKAAFHFQRHWIRDYDEAVSISKDYENIDIESELYKHHHEMFMLRRLELSHQNSSPAIGQLASASHLTLSSLIDVLSPMPDATFVQMNLTAPNQSQHFTDTEDIKQFDLRRVLINGEGKQAHFTQDYALLDVHYRRGKDEKNQVATILFTAEGEDDHSLYTRLVITFPVSNASRINSLSNEERYPHSTSLMIALDRADGHQQELEFHYMWTDAQLKASHGEQESLTEDQRMLCQVAQADIAYNLYWGQQCFNSERYYEAILHLENVYNSYCEDFFEMTTDQRRTFLEVSYKLGFCYNELGLYKQAFYYLDLTSNDGNIRHTMEMVNTMANGKDVRLFSYTEAVMDEVKHNFGEDDDMPDNIKDFINFLRRRRGYAFINFNQLDKAEKIFTQMLNEEDNADYAIRELAHIKDLRQRNENADAHTGEQESNDDDGETHPIKPPF